ncbi:MAG: hypothetical protein ACREOQ_00410 [Gemmatimonadales bacterium]
MKLRTRATTAFLLTIVAARADGQDAKPAASGAPEYARYPTPGACAAAVERVYGTATWGEDSDSFPYDPSRPLPAAVAAAARRCVERFLPAGGVAALSGKDVDAMFMLGLTAGDDSLAAAALRRTVARQRSKRDSTDVLVGALDAYLNGRPARLVLAQGLARRLDSLGYREDLPPGQWSNPHSKVLQLAKAMLDSAAMTEEAEAVLAAVRALPEQERRGGWVLGAVLSTLSIDQLWTLRAYGPDSMFPRMKSQVTALLGPDALQTSPLLGLPAPPLQPDFWFGREPADSVLPRPGRVTLLIGCGGGACDNAVLRRLKTRYGDSLELILLAPTQGRHGPYIPLAPQREAELLRDSYLGTHQLPAKLGVWITQYTSRPDPDRRRVSQPPASDFARFGMGGRLLDQRGIVLAPSADPRYGNEAFVTAMIDALLKRSRDRASSGRR